MKKYEDFELDLTNQEINSKVGTRVCLSNSSALITNKNCSKGCINPTTKGCNTVNTCRTMNL